MHKVSVITPVYNCAQYLEETVASVRTQNYADWELILWDDGSTDKTPEICRKLAEEDSRIRFFRSEKTVASVSAAFPPSNTPRGVFWPFWTVTTSGQKTSFRHR